MDSITFWLTLIVMTAAVITDLRSRRIPNWLVVPFLAAGVIFRGVTGGLPGLGRSLAGAGLAAGVLSILCYSRGMGMGDLKLFAAAGAWIGPAQLVTALVVAAIAGGALAVACALWTRSLGRHLDAAADLAIELCGSGFRPHRTIHLGNPAAARVPYALAIAIGTMFSFYAV